MKTFENFLVEKHASLRITQDFERWLDSIDIDLWIELGDEFGRLCMEGENVD